MTESRAHHVATYAIDWVRMWIATRSKCQWMASISRERISLRPTPKLIVRWWWGWIPRFEWFQHNFARFNFRHESRKELGTFAVGILSIHQHSPDTAAQRDLIGTKRSTEDPSTEQEVQEHLPDSTEDNTRKCSDQLHGPLDLLRQRHLSRVFVPSPLPFSQQLHAAAQPSSLPPKSHGPFLAFIAETRKSRFESEKQEEEEANDVVRDLRVKNRSGQHSTEALSLDNWLQHADPRRVGRGDQQIAGEGLSSPPPEVACKDVGQGKVNSYNTLYCS